MGTAELKGIKEKSYKLFNSKDLDPLMERIGNARFVLLGEASHGTHEYYTWRTAISKRLITEKGFSFIAVEGDWPDCYRINRYIKGHDNQELPVGDLLKTFNRWPTWMWANWEIAALITWLRELNRQKPPGKKAGFYGLDVYSLWESMEALLEYLKRTDMAAARIAEEAMNCFVQHGKNEAECGQRPLPQSCHEHVIRLLVEIRKKAMFYNHDPEASLNTVQNAYIALGAEKYYNSLLQFSDNSWNIRDRHMMDTLERLIDFHGPVQKPSSGSIIRISVMPAIQK
jgi:erythromycin esterase